MGQVQLDGYVLTHKGIVRENNEDNFLLFGSYKKDCSETKRSLSKKAYGRRHLVALFDGMGGEEYGEVASLLAAKRFCPCDLSDAELEIRRQITDVNKAVCEEMRRQSCRMGTTAVLLYFDQACAVCANIGDSRAYLYRSGELRQLSVDHSEGQKLIDAGVATWEDARYSSSWHRLTKHIGLPDDAYDIEPYIGDEILLQNQDLFLLATDGLTDMVSDEIIHSVLKTEGSNITLSDMAGRLLGRAIENGGRDNVSILLVKVRMR